MAHPANTRRAANTGRAALAPISVQVTVGWDLLWHLADRGAGRVDEYLGDYHAPSHPRGELRDDVIHTANTLTPQACELGLQRVEVSGLEPPTSTLRMQIRYFCCQAGFAKVLVDREIG